MIEKMRRRVILSAMLAFFAVISLIAILVNVINYCVVTARLDDTLESIYKFEAGDPEERSEPGPPRGPFMELPDPESNYMTRFFIVRYDDEKRPDSVYTDYVATIDEKSAGYYGSEALARRAERGYINEYRYQKAGADGRLVIIFLNAFREVQFMKSLMGLTIIVSVVSLLLVFVLVVLLSRRAIKPISDNINRQKQFITDASHELKTPLTSINTSIDVLTMEHGDDEWTDNIKKQTARMSRLVSELVTLSRLDEEHPLPDREQFSLSNAAWEIIDVYKSQAAAGEKTLETDIEDDISIYGEKASIQQMLSVLLDNALRYSDPAGNIRFSIYRKRNRTVIEVFNTCQYETPPDTERLFDRFYRPDGARSTETGGTGIGLSIARAVAEAHGGNISASCPSGKTMTMKVVLK